MKLAQLMLDANAFTGALEPDFGSNFAPFELTNLNPKLSVGNTRLCGPVPAGLFSLPSPFTM